MLRGRLERVGGVDPGGDHRDADLAVEIGVERRAPDDVGVGIDQLADVVRGLVHLEQRSEEHTSELQSLMRISYAVFCLKKKKYNNTIKEDDEIEYYR